MTVSSLAPAVQASTAPAAFAAVRANGLRLSTARRLLLQAVPTGRDETPPRHAGQVHADAQNRQATFGHQSGFEES